MKGRYFVLIFLVLFLVFFCSQKVKAQEIPTHDVVINELMWMGSEDKNYLDEWIELYNNTEKKINLTDWYLEYQNNSGIITQLKIQGNIKPFSYFLISNYNLDGHTILDSSKINIDEVYAINTISLSNDFGFYRLYDLNNILIDEIGKINFKPFAGININGDFEQKASMERNSPLLDGTIKTNWHSSTLQTNLILSLISYGTPGAENSIYIPPPPPENYFGKIIFIKIFPNPAGKDDKNEWLEIKNISDKEIDLLNWKIIDASNTNCKTLLTIIKPNEVLKISELSCINNQTETLSLFDQNKNLINQTSWNYKTPDNASYYLDANGKWKWKIPQIEYKKLTIKEAKKQPLKTYVKIQATVSASPNIFSQYYFFVQDETAGLKIRCKEKLDSMSVGDIVEIKGYIKNYYNEIIVYCDKKSDIKIIGHQSIEPKNINLGQVGENQNLLIKTIGKVVLEKSKYYLDDGYGRIRIYFSTYTKIKKPKYFSKSIIEIIGIVDFYKNYFRLMPRINEDIFQIQSGKKPKKIIVPKAKTAKLVNVKNTGPPIILGKDYRNGIALFDSSNSQNNYEYIKVLSLVLIGIGICGLIGIGLISKIKY